MMIIYADLIFLINFASNYAMLWLTGTAVKRKTTLLRLLLSAGAGALGGVFILCINTAYIISAAIKICLAVIMLLIAYGRPRLLRLLGAFILVTYAFSGIALMLISVFNLNTVSVIKNGIIYFDISDKILFFALAAGFSLSLLAAKIIHSRKKLIPLRITLNERTVTVNALYDSGNLLKDPASGKSVIIADRETAEYLLGYGYSELLEKFGELNMRLLPYRTVGNPSDTLLVFTADTVRAEGQTIKNAPVGIADGPLCAKGDYHALIGNI